jgi:hypothetical protein
MAGHGGTGKHAGPGGHGGPSAPDGGKGAATTVAGQPSTTLDPASTLPPVRQPGDPSDPSQRDSTGVTVPQTPGRTQLPDDSPVPVPGARLAERVDELNGRRWQYLVDGTDQQNCDLAREAVVAAGFTVTGANLCPLPGGGGGMLSFEGKDLAGSVLTSTESIEITVLLP